MQSKPNRNLKQKLQDEKLKLRNSWKMSCKHLAEQDAVITAKDEEINELKRKLAEMRDGMPHHYPGGTVETLDQTESLHVIPRRKYNSSGSTPKGH